MSFVFIGNQLFPAMFIGRAIVFIMEFDLDLGKQFAEH